MNYYNDNDPHAAAWLSNLRDAGEIPNGRVDDRSIRDVAASDLRGFVQAHWFAGIGGWPLALRLAGWPDDQPVWTASCPCQPFSNAGKRAGVADDRHLWPTVAGLVGECRPAILFGEQVASADGRDWLAGVRLDLERMGYAVGAADMCAAGVGAPHVRQRIYFGAIRLADTDDGVGLKGRPVQRKCDQRGDAEPRAGFTRGSGSCGLADTDDDGCQAGRSATEAVGYRHPVDATGRARSLGVGDPDRSGLARPEGVGRNAIPQLAPVERAGPWTDSEWLACKDGKSRRVKPGVPLLADGLPRDVAGALAGLGNAIVPQVAAAFISSFTEAVREWQR